MPIVGKKVFPYTPAGKADAAKHKQEQTAARVAKYGDYVQPVALPQDKLDKMRAGWSAKVASAGRKDRDERTAKYDKERDARTAKSRASRATKKMRDGGRVENGHDVTDARGSGAARTQRFKKNG